jgi:CDP-diacylglycerol--serine O-phosphatidyltransferase
MKTDHPRRGIYMLPALFTTGNLFFGFYALIEAINGHFFEAGIGIILAGVFDGLDGRVARLTRTTSQFGVEYDSLADMLSFGLAPAILLYTWALQPFGKWGWLAAFLYAACAALRLARFNVQSETDELRWFAGIPSPGAAAVVCTLMVSKIRYRTLKEFDFRSPRAPWVLLVIVVGIIVIAADPAKTLFFMAVGYAVSGPLEALIFMRQRRQARALERLRAAGAEPGRRR